MSKRIGPRCALALTLVTTFGCDGGVGDGDPSAVPDSPRTKNAGFAMVDDAVSQLDRLETSPQPIRHVATVYHDRRAMGDSDSRSVETRASVVIYSVKEGDKRTYLAYAKLYAASMFAPGCEATNTRRVAFPMEDVDEDSAATAERGSEASLEEDSSFVSAGDAITVTDDNGTFITLTRLEYSPELAYYGYSDDDAVPGLTGGNPVIDMPGETVSAVSAFPLIDADLSAEAGFDRIETLQLDETYRWIPGSDGALIVLRGSAGDLESEQGGIAFRCVLEDTGQFTLPDNVRAELASDVTQFHLYAAVDRRRYDVSLRGDVLMISEASAQAGEEFDFYDHEGHF